MKKTLLGLVAVSSLLLTGCVTTLKRYPERTVIYTQDSPPYQSSSPGVYFIGNSRPKVHSRPITPPPSYHRPPVHAPQPHFKKPNHKPSGHHRR